MSHSRVGFRLLPRGFTHRDLRAQLGELLGRDFSAGSMTYDLRRLRLRGLIERVPQTNRYRVTDDGVRTAALYSRTHNQILRPAMAELIRPIGAGPISAAIRQLDKASRLPDLLGGTGPINGCGLVSRTGKGFARGAHP